MVPGGVGTAYLPVSKAEWSGLDVTATGLDLAAAPSGPLRITLAANIATIHGRVLDWLRQPATLAALLFVDDAHGTRTAFASAGLLGGFQVYLAAGDYRVYALRDINAEGTFESAAYLAQHANDFPILHAVGGVNSPLDLTLR
jgi:hypothetical protein